MKLFNHKKQVLGLSMLLFSASLFSQTFVEQTDISLPGVAEGSATWGDYDNDGDQDILLTDISLNSQNVTIIYRNDNGIFNDTNAELGRLFRLYLIDIKHKVR